MSQKKAKPRVPATWSQLADMLASHFEKPFERLPAHCRQAVEACFTTHAWGDLSPEGRRREAAGYDARQFDAGFNEGMADQVATERVKRHGAEYTAQKAERAAQKAERVTEEAERKAEEATRELIEAERAVSEQNSNNASGPRDRDALAVLIRKAISGFDGKPIPKPAYESIIEKLAEVDTDNCLVLADPRDPSSYYDGFVVTWRDKDVEHKTPVVRISERISRARKAKPDKAHS